MMIKIFNRNCIMLVAVVFGLISPPLAIAGEISKAFMEHAYHHLFEEMIKKGFDCVHDFEACRTNAPPGKLPPGKLSPATIEAIKRSFVQNQAPSTPPTINVVPAGSGAAAR